jgi:hypothetical protein
MPADPIRIEVDRSGGFADRAVHAAIDTSSLPVDQAKEISDLVDRVDFAALAGRGPAQRHAGRPDRFQYDLTVRQAGSTYRLSLPESDLPAELKELLGRVMAYGQET